MKIARRSLAAREYIDIVGIYRHDRASPGGRKNLLLPDQPMGLTAIGGETLTGGMCRYTVAPKWQEGDAQLLDDTLASHGRAMFADPRVVHVMLVA